MRSVDPRPSKGPTIPRRALVHRTWYRIVRCPRKKVPHESNGYCDADAATIYVATELPPAQAFVVFEHELGHAAFYESGAQQVVEGFTTRAEDLEELIVSTLLPVYLSALDALGVKR